MEGISFVLCSVKIQVLSYHVLIFVNQDLEHDLTLFGVSSLAWTMRLVHVAIPESRWEYIRCNNILDVLPHPDHPISHDFLVVHLL